MKPYAYDRRDEHGSIQMHQGDETPRVRADEKMIPLYSAEQVADLVAENSALKTAVEGVNQELYGQGFKIAGWHLNGDLQSLDSWFEENDWNPETPATDAYLAQLRNEARSEGLDEMARVYRGWADEDRCSHNMQCSYRLTAERAESYAAYIRRELREGKASPQSAAMEYPKNNSSSNGWTIDPQFLSRVSDRAEAVYGYRPGLEETEAALLAGLDLLREGKAGEVVSD